MLFGYELVIWFFVGDSPLNDGKEVWIVLKVVVCLLVFTKHEIANSNVIVKLLLTVYSILKQRFKLIEEVLLLLFIGIVSLKYLIQIFAE